MSTSFIVSCITHTFWLFVGASWKILALSGKELTKIISLYLFVSVCICGLNSCFEGIEAACGIWLCGFQLPTGDKRHRNLVFDIVKSTWLYHSYKEIVMYNCVVVGNNNMGVYHYDLEIFLNPYSRIYLNKWLSAIFLQRSQVPRMCFIPDLYVYILSSLSVVTECF